MHQIPEDDDVARNRLCSDCIGEAFLSLRVEEEGEVGPCTYCGEEQKTFSLAEVADAVEVVFDKHYYKTSTNPDYDEWPHETWVRKGTEVLYVLEDLVEIEEPAAEDLLRVLSSRHFDIEVVRMGDECQFDPHAYYAETRVTPAEFEAEWTYFEQNLKTNARFFNRTGAAFLASIFEGIGELRNEDGQPVVIEAGPGREIAALYRARVFQSVEKLQHAIEYPNVELGPPPARLAAAGRMNALGISVFYGAVEPDTAIAEVRPPVGSRVLLGRFELSRTLRLLDVEVLRAIYVKGSLFDPGFSRNLERAKFLAGLSWRMTKPVLPEQEPFEHLATQAIADFLSSEADPTVDGMVYPSVQASSGKPNVVLFHKSSRVEALNVPAGTDVHSHCSWIDPSDDRAQDDYEDEGDRYWVFEEVAPPETSQPVEQEKHSIIPLRFPNAAEFDARDSALKLDIESLEVRHIREITVKTASSKVDRMRREKTKPFGPLASMDDLPF